MGAKIKSKIMLAAALVGFVLLAFYPFSLLKGWLSAQDMEGLYSALHWALLLVILGVIVEEWELIFDFCKFARYTWIGRFHEACRKAWSHRGKIAEGIGFAILTIGLALELVIDPLLEGKQKDSEVRAKTELEDQRKLTEKAQTDAASANTKAAALLAENVELERALAPRQIDQGAIAHDISALPRVQIFISSVDREEPKQVAHEFAVALQRMKIGDTPTWSVESLPNAAHYLDGIRLLYTRPFDVLATRENPGKKVAEAVCKELQMQGISASTEAIRENTQFFASEWPPNAPNTAVIIQVGAKPNHFWENKMLRAKGMEELPETAFCLGSVEESFERALAEREKRLTGVVPKAVP